MPKLEEDIDASFRDGDVPPPCGGMAEMEAKMTWNALLNRRKLSSRQRAYLVRRKANAIRAL